MRGEEICRSIINEGTSENILIQERFGNTGRGEIHND
jgi:hypothetical protein